MTTPSSSGTSSPYRNEIDALRERKETLEREIARLKDQTTQLEGLRSREQELEHELAGVAQKLGARSGKRALPMLDQVKVASPCSANWDEMLGDDRVRFCVSCEKNVYNLSAMPREDGERLLQERLQGELCVRFYQRTDGTIMTQDCPVGVKKKRRKKLAIAVAGAGALAFAATTALMRGSNCEMNPVQGGLAMPIDTTTTTPTMGEPTTTTPAEGWVTGDRVDTPPPPPPTPHVMGSIAAPPPAPPTPPPPPNVKMGRRAR